MHRHNLISRNVLGNCWVGKRDWNSLRYFWDVFKCHISCSSLVFPDWASQAAKSLRTPRGGAVNIMYGNQHKHCLKFLEMVGLRVSMKNYACRKGKCFLGNAGPKSLLVPCPSVHPGGRERLGWSQSHWETPTWRQNTVHDRRHFDLHRTFTISKMK